jgi:formate hydrogenlyase subunit 3/multisubunit Na+/H+ antiporter MnhD subunit
MFFFFRLLLFGDSLFGSSCAIVSIDPFRPLWLILFLFFTFCFFLFYSIRFFFYSFIKKKKTKERKNKFPIAFFCVCCCWPVLAPVGLLVAFVSNVPAIRLSSAAQSYVSVRSCLSSEILDGFIDLTALWV